MRNRTYPKENQKKLNETIRELRAELRQAEKERDFYKREVEHLVKPVRNRKQHIEQPKMSEAEWRIDFLRRYRTEVLGKKE